MLVACEFCSKRFGQAIRLRDHINNQHGTKQVDSILFNIKQVVNISLFYSKEIFCTECPKVFHSMRNLKGNF